MCATCNNNIQSIGGIPMHIGSLFSHTSRLWEGPFIFISYKNKDEVEDKLKPQLKSSLLGEEWFFSFYLKDLQSNLNSHFL
jgi:hypothetical protein